MIHYILRNFIESNFVKKLNSATSLKKYLEHILYLFLVRTSFSCSSKIGTWNLLIIIAPQYSLVFFSKWLAYTNACNVVNLVLSENILVVH